MTSTHLALKLFQKCLTEAPQKTFLTCNEQNFTFEEVYLKAAQLAEQLKSTGLKLKDRVIVRFWNEPNFVIAYFAVLMGGGVAVTISPLLTENEIAQIVEHSGAELILSFDKANPKELFIETLNPLETTFLVENSPEDLAVLIYTSGTTANPKGVMLTESNIKAQIEAASQVMQVNENDSFLGILSLAHVFGQMDILWLALYKGNTVHLLPKFEAKAAVELLCQHPISILIAVPTMYRLMLRHLERHPQTIPNLRLCHSGAAPLSAKLFSEIETHFKAPMQEGYGLTETCSMAFSNPLQGKRKALSVGKPIGQTEFKLISDNGELITSPNEIGEVCIKGSIISLGYFNAPKLTTQAITPDSWLLTGDLGYVDEEGYLFLVDRKKDLIIRGGYKVYPREVEEVLSQHPLVQQAAVIGCKSALSIEKTIAFIIPKCSLIEADANNLSLELKQLCHEKLAQFKIPNRFQLVQSIPCTPSGKLLKRKLKDQLTND